MQIKTVQHKLSFVLFIISLVFSILVVLLSLTIFTNVKRYLGTQIYESYVNSYKSDLQSYVNLESNRCFELKQFVENEYSTKKRISAAELESVLQLNNNSNAHFYSFGVMILPAVELDTAGGYGIYDSKQGFSMELVNSYFGFVKLHSFDKIIQNNQVWAYNKVIESGMPIVLEPYERTEFDEIKIFTAVLVPILQNRRTIGIVKLEINLSELNLNEFNNADRLSEIRLISYNGKIAANNKNYFVGRNISEFERNFTSHLLDIQSAKANTKVNGNSIIVQMHFELLKNTSAYWQLEVSIEAPPFFTVLKRNLSIIISSMIILLFVFQIVFSYYLKKNLRPLVDILYFVEKLKIGDIEITEQEIPNNEFKRIYSGLLVIVENLKYLASIAIEIGKGNLNVSYKLRSENDILGKAILEMEERLKQSNEEEKKLKSESVNRAWISEGLAEFGMRLKDTNLTTKELFNTFLSALIDYINAVQGTIFQMHRRTDSQENWYLELISAYAYHQNKYLERKVLLGEGLVGMCAKERQSVIIKEVPGNYVFIKSAFGATVPKNIVIIPLIFNEIVYGVLEVATLSDFEDYKVEFLNQLSENIANTLAISESTEQTNLLLQQTQKQSSELMTREEELRQNLEELQTTQELYQKNMAHMNSYLNALNVFQMVVEFTKDGKVDSFNKNFAKFLNLSETEVKGLNLMSLMSIEVDTQNKMMAALFNDQVFELESNLQFGSVKKYYRAVFSAILGQHGEIIKIIGVGTETNEFYGHNL
jgi:PAS domain-containing protein